MKDQEVPVKWYQIKDYSNYRASNHGVIERIKPKRVITGYWSKGVYVVKLTNEIGPKEFLYHHVVWKNINGEIPKDHGIYHVNGIKSDNAVWNLKAITKKELGKKTGHRTRKTTPLVLLDSNGIIIDSFRSGREAAKMLFCSYQTIYDIVNGKVKKPMFNIRFESDFTDEGIEKKKRGKKVKEV